MHRLFAIILFACTLCNSVFGLNKPVQNNRELKVIWFTSFPFIYEDENGTVTGIEKEMFELFRDYMQQKNGKNIQITFSKAPDFSGVLSSMKNGDATIAGASALSITAERQEYAQFTISYLPDVTVLVSSAGTPIVQTIEEKLEMVRNLDAVTIKGTKYETLLNDLEEETGVSLKTIYINSDQNILDGIMGEPDRFGFIDLPIYLMRIQNGGEVVRQNFFTTIGQGYAFILPDNSIWKDYLDDFLADPQSQQAISDIISKYLGEELFEFVDNLHGIEELGTSILTKEKEMQLALIRNANLKLEEELAVRKILIISTSVLSVLLFVIGYLLYKNYKSTRLLMGQKEQIEEQQTDIHLKNEQLINRNAQLVALNEEKNNLVRILAHDIRSPLSQIIMITEIVNKNVNQDITEQEQKMLNQVTISAERINQMVTKILDVDGLEENRVKVLHERVDIRTIMKDVSQRYRPIAAQKDIDLTVEFCEEHNMIRTDHLLLLLVLENLVSNAVKFSQSGTCVSLKSECEYDSALFMVSDEGPGFSDDDKKKLFNRFQKLSAKPTAGESSTGLGLSIVKKYVNDLGGEVWVESEMGKGSTFFVKLTV